MFDIPEAAFGFARNICGRVIGFNDETRPTPR
jgi:hypothetical protein